MLSFHDERLRYRPCREDGLDVNLKFLNPADYEVGLGHRGLVTPCSFDWCELCAARRVILADEP